MSQLKKMALAMVAIFVLIISASIGETASFSLGENIGLASLLEDRLFSALATEGPYYKIDLFGMCNGKLLVGCEVTSDYGWREHPIYRRRHFHTGIDLAAPKSSYIFAPADGVVTIRGRSRGYGRLVELDHGFAWSTRYAHMRRIYVKKGQQVKKGDIIGEVGSSGSSTGPHLHFEMIYFGSTVNPVSYFASLDHIKDYPITFANR